MADAVVAANAADPSGCGFSSNCSGDSAKAETTFSFMTRYLFPIAVGSVLGSLMGYFGQCSSGTCPLTST